MSFDKYVKAMLMRELKKEEAEYEERLKKVREEIETLDKTKVREER